MGGKHGNSWLVRVVRGRRLDRNPLRRASDRAETLMLLALVITFLAAAPLVALAVGAWVHGAAHRVQLGQERARFPVSALVLEVTPETGSYAYFYAPAQARWTAPSGRVTTGALIVPAGTAAGTTVPVWITRAGQLTPSPLQDSQVSELAQLAEAGGVGVTALAVAVAGTAGRRALSKRRLAAWDAGWRATGPRWTTRA